jgi:hypothetical protein
MDATTLGNDTIGKTLASPLFSISVYQRPTNVFQQASSLHRVAQPAS